MNLYNKCNNNIDTIFKYEPSEKHWWITGFNPEYVGNVDVHKQVMVGKIDMSQFEDSNGENAMFENLYSRISDDKKLSKYMLFDEKSNTVWVMWYE
ncbi:MAG: DUF5113 domain-containing protein [Oscillospiraceae bacterium]